MNEKLSIIPGNKMSDQIKKEIEGLRKKILEADKAYYVDSEPIMSDAEYDQLYDKLKEIEKDNPELFDPNSPTSRVNLYNLSAPSISSTCFICATLKSIFVKSPNSITFSISDIFLCPH